MYNTSRRRQIWYARDIDVYTAKTRLGPVIFEWNATDSDTDLLAVMETESGSLMLETPYKFRDAKDVYVAAKLIAQYHDLGISTDLRKL